MNMFIRIYEFDRKVRGQPKKKLNWPSHPVEGGNLCGILSNPSNLQTEWTKKEKN